MNEIMFRTSKFLLEINPTEEMQLNVAHGSYRRQTVFPKDNSKTIQGNFLGLVSFRITCQICLGRRDT